MRLVKTPKKIKTTPSRARKQAQRSATKTSTPLSLRKRDILERAARLMQHKGYDGISAQQIADALEFSKANFFYHVKTKEDLLFHIFVDTLQFTIRHMEEVMARQQSASETLAAVIDVYMQLMIDHAAVMQVWFREKDHLTAKHRAEIERLEARIKAILGPFYTKAISSGEFRDVDPQLAVVAMFGMCFAVTRWPELQKRLSAGKLTEGMQALALGAMLRPKS